MLRSLPFAPMHNEHEMGGDTGHMDLGHHHHTGPARLTDGSGFCVLRLVVTERIDYARRAPGTLSESPRRDFTEVATWPITLSMATGRETTRWLINGLTHEMDEYPIVVRRGAKEIWEIRNDEKSMPHLYTSTASGSWSSRGRAARCRYRASRWTGAAER